MAISQIPESLSLRAIFASYLPGLYLLGAISGLIDAACFLGLGAVFAEMMTGNLVMLAFSIAGTETITVGDWASPWSYVIVLATFAAGAAICGILMRKSQKLARNRKLFIVQWMMIVAAALVAWALSPTGHGGYSVLIVAILSFAMGFQNALVLRHGVPNLATNLMTLTYTALFANSPRGNPMWIRRTFSIITFVAGALFGVWLLRFGVAAAFGAAAVLMTLALYWLITKPAPPELTVVK